MIAGRVADVTDLNLRARERMLAAGEVSGPTLTVNDLDFAAGDEVICLRNDRRLGVVNGTRGRITAVDVAAGTVTLATRAGERQLSQQYLKAGHVTYGYAITAHKAQGMTTNRTWVLGTDEIYREWGYTALSRHRDQAHLYIVDGTGVGPEQHPHTLQQPCGAIEEVSRRLGRSRGQHLASDSKGAALQTAPATDPPAQSGEPPGLEAVFSLTEVRPADRWEARKQSHVDRDAEIGLA